MKESNTLYDIAFMPGFGCSSNIFSKLDLNGLRPLFLEWQTPKKKELLQDYVSRLVTPEIQNNPNIILAGHSFGGVVMQEMAHILGTDKVVLISSMSNEAGKSRFLKRVKKLKLHNFVSKPSIKSTMWMWAKSADLKGDTKQHFKETLPKVDSRYYTWAVKNLANWKENPLHDYEIYQLHGSADSIFPIDQIENPIVIDNGGHLMVYDDADAVSKALIGVIS